MIYAMPVNRYNELRKSGLNHIQIIEHVNESLCMPVVKQTSLVAEDGLTKERQRISVSPIQLITEVITK